MSTQISRFLLWILGVLVLTTSLASAQVVDPSFGRFEPFGQLAAKLDDQVLADAEMFLDQQAVAYLLLSPGLDRPVLLQVRTQKVARVDVAKVRRNDNGTVSLLNGGLVGTVVPFQVSSTELAATLDDGHRLTLGPKPHLLGTQTADSLAAHDPSYAYRAGKYPPSEKYITELKQETREVTVKVFFGSWCKTCSRMVPWLLRVEQALEGSKIHFEYYGLPAAMDDPEGKKMGVDGVPTAIVLVDGEEVGRRSSPGLGVPEKALLAMLGES